MMKKILFLIIFTVFFIESIFADPPWDFNTYFYTLPFSHFKSVEGSRFDNYTLEFNGIDLTSPIDNSPFLIPSLYIFSNLKNDSLISNKFTLVKREKRDTFGFYRDGLSMKSGASRNISNTLFFSKAFSDSFSLSIGILNSGKSYYHYNNVFHGPGVEILSVFNKGNSKLSFYGNIQFTNDSSYLFDELENSSKLKFEDDALAKFAKIFGGISYIYDSDFLSFLSSLSYGGKSQRGDNQKTAYYSSNTNSWTGNFPYNISDSYFKFKNKISLRLIDNKDFKIIPTAHIILSSANSKREIPEEGIMFDNNLKIFDYGYSNNATLTKLSPALYFSKAFNNDSVKFFADAGFDFLWYSGENWGKSILLASPKIISALNIKTGALRMLFGFSLYSSPINLAKLFYLGNNFYPYSLSFFDGNNWNNIKIQNIIRYSYDNSSSYNRVKRVNFSLSYKKNDLNFKLSSVFSKTTDFWNRMDTLSDFVESNGIFIKESNCEKIYIGAPLESKKNILFSPYREFFGINLNISKHSEKLNYLFGVSYMKTTGNYDNQYYSILDSFSSDSILFLSPNMQKPLLNGFDLSFGNGIKVYSHIKYNFSKRLKLELLFIHFPPINYFSYATSGSAIGLIPDKREKTSSFNYISAGGNYSFGKITLSLFIKNALNSSPPLMLSVWDNGTLKTAIGIQSFIGIFYRF